MHFRNSQLNNIFKVFILQEPSQTLLSLMYFLNFQKEIYFSEVPKLLNIGSFPRGKPLRNQASRCTSLGNSAINGLLPRFGGLVPREIFFLFPQALFRKVDYSF